MSSTFLKVLLVCLLVTCISLSAQSQANQQMRNIIDQYDTHLKSFPPNTLVLDFKLMLNNELSGKNSGEEQNFYRKLEEKLKQLNPQDLNEGLKTDYHIILYEAKLNLEKLELIQKTQSKEVPSNLDKINGFEIGSEWYAWLIKKWTGTLQTPEEIMAFGEKEVQRVKNEIKKLNLPPEKPKDWYTKSSTTINEKLKEKRELISQKIRFLMPEYTELPALRIALGTNSRLAKTPGYYSGNTFYYNLFEKPFDLADCDWLLIHEGNPGHHFQVNYHNQIFVKDYRSNLRYMGFVEGWAAYTENLGWEMGLYKSPWEALGKWNWDIIRSVRIVLDIGLNYYGWTDEKALKHWQQHIQDKDDIAHREINRMKRWPAQVLTYKLGEAALLELLQREKRNKGELFSYKTFHSQVLSKGIIPVFMIKDLINPLQ